MGTREGGSNSFCMNHKTFDFIIRIISVRLIITCIVTNEASFIMVEMFHFHRYSVMKMKYDRQFIQNYS